MMREFIFLVMFSILSLCSACVHLYVMSFCSAVLVPLYTATFGDFIISGAVL